MQDLVFHPHRGPGSRGWAAARCAPGSSGCARRGCGCCGWCCCGPGLLFLAFLIFSAIWAVLARDRKREDPRTARRQRRHVAAVAERRVDMRDRADLRGVPVPGLHLHGAAKLEGDVAGGDRHRPLVRGRARRLGAGESTSCRSPSSGSGCVCSTAITGSLYPCIAAHSLNNSIAYGSLENWKFLQVVALIAGCAAVDRRARCIGGEARRA